MLSYIKNRLAYWIIVPAIIGILIWIQFSIGNKFGDPDGYYHLTIAKLWNQGAIDSAFPWLQQTILKDNFADQHSLLHILLVPFDSIFFGKIFIILATLLCLTAFYFLAKQLRIRFALFWTIVLVLCSSGFLFRINLLKAETLSLAFLFLAIALSLKEKYWWLLPVSSAYALLYSGGIVLLPISLLAITLTEYLAHKKINLKPLAIAGGGIILGILVHPQSSTILSVLVAQLQVPHLIRTVNVGTEWYPYPWRTLIFEAGIPLAAVIVGAGIFLYNWRNAKNNITAIWLLLLSVLFSIGLLISRRFVTYAAAFSILFLGSSINPFLQRFNLNGAKKIFSQNWQTKISALTLTILIISMVGFSIKRTERLLNNAMSGSAYQGASQWLIQNATPKSIVFNTHWDQFPQLFFYNQQNYYVTGLDATFMYRLDEGGYWKWRSISGDNPDNWMNTDIHTIIKDDFRASYVFLEKYRNPFLYDHLKYSTKFTLAYEDSNTAVFTVK